MLEGLFLKYIEPYKNCSPLFICTNFMRNLYLDQLYSKYKFIYIQMQCIGHFDRAPRHHTSTRNGSTNYWFKREHYRPTIVRLNASRMRNMVSPQKVFWGIIFKVREVNHVVDERRLVKIKISCNEDNCHNFVFCSWTTSFLRKQIVYDECN